MADQPVGSPALVSVPVVLPANTTGTAAARCGPTTSKLYARLGVNWVKVVSSEVGASTPVAKAVMVGSAVSVGAKPRSIVRVPWVVLPPPEPVSVRRCRFPPR